MLKINQIKSNFGKFATLLKQFLKFNFKSLMITKSIAEKAAPNATSINHAGTNIIKRMPLK